MNQQLWEAHLENLALRQQLRNMSVYKRGRHRCIYCGAVTESNLRACPVHRDLPAVDPDYAGRRSL